MRLIVMTADRLFDDEPRLLNALFKEGMPRLHIRKPSASAEEMRNLIVQIDERYYDRLVLHDCFELLESFPLLGVHLNKRNPDVPMSRPVSVSCSCHSLSSLKPALQVCDYVFLSPIFDSISKTGYYQAFTEQELIEARELEVINDRVIALGGMSEQTIPLAAAYGFGGAAVLGALWGNTTNVLSEKELIKRLNRLWTIIKNQ